MMKQTKHILFSLSLLAATALLAACNSVLGDDDIVSNQGGTMQLAFTRSGESSSPDSGFLIFWKTTMKDFFTAEVDDVTKYGSTKFNTGEPYPKDGTQVSATGFSPANMGLSDDYQTLTLPASTVPGTLDVCAAAKVIKGSYYNIFNEAMSFQHTLTKVTFSVQRDETMVGSRDVGNITISIPRNYLPTRWKWNENQYAADLTAPANAALAFTHPGIIKETKTDEIGTAYLMLPANNNGQLADIRVQADISLIESATVETEIDRTLDVPLHEKDNATQVDKAYPGESYEIVVKFQQNSFTLIARRSDWVNGGLIYVPVKP